MSIKTTNPTHELVSSIPRGTPQPLPVQNPIEIITDMENYLVNTAYEH